MIKPERALAAGLLAAALCVPATAQEPARANAAIETVVEGLTGESTGVERQIPAEADRIHPLGTIDTSSPRATLQSYRRIMEIQYQRLVKVLDSYLSSDRLFMSAEENALIEEGNHQLELAARAFSVEGLPPALLRGDFLKRKAIQLIGIFNRLDLPPDQEIPDAEAISKAEFKRWSIPDTEITIARVEEGKRAGEYLFTAETVERLDEFYRRISYLPPRPGSSVGWYKAYNYGAGGLREWIPYRWLLSFPDWAKTRFFDQPVWRWIGIFGAFAVAITVVYLLHFLQRKLAAAAHAGPLRKAWLTLLAPLSPLLVIPPLIDFLDTKLRVTGSVATVVEETLWAAFYLSLTWLVWNTGTAASTTLIRTQGLSRRGIDSQLLRFGLRLLVIMIGIAILVEGAHRIGLPAYSVVAGLGISGIAVAMAARESLSNLLGSLIIMFEKPFLIGHWIRTGGTEGKVENINFRSTRIRTFYDSLISIPNNKIIDSMVENMELRNARRQKFMVQVVYGTSAADVQRFIDGIKQVIQDNEYTLKDNFHVALHDLGAHSLDILVYVFLKVPDRAAELRERQNILFEIMRLSEKLGVEFAFPTQTLHLTRSEAATGP